jgi:hypothetical protein
MTVDDRIDMLAARNIRRLQDAYPGWVITREGARLKATNPEWGALYGGDVSELRTRLERWTATYNIEIAT